MKHTNDTDTIISDWEQALSQSGLRLTRSRRAILGIIASSHRPLTPIEIYDQARASQPSIGLVTVYRTIERLAELNLVERVHQSSHCQTIFRATQAHRHLIICSRCGDSVYFDGLDVEESFSQIGESLGYRVTNHWLQLEGLCPKCREGS